MPKTVSIFHNALFLTAVNLLLRLIGTGFQVYISRRMGAAGVGLLQLTMSVGSLAMVAGIAGVRTASMYLTAEELGRKRPGQVPWILSGCFRYSLCCSLLVAVILHLFAPQIASHWIGDVRTVDALRLFSTFLPVTCLCGVMTGYFTAACRIRTLAAVEVAEQLFSMGITIALLTFWAGHHPGRACQSVILGSGMGSILTLSALTVLRIREHSPIGKPIPIARRLLDTALPLGAADVLKSGINTVENLMVPRRLEANPSISSPLAAFGMVSGMVFPVVMFPACILFGLAELLIPELSRCQAAGSRTRISYLVRTGLRISLLYGVLFSGAVFLLAEPICQKLYHSTEAAQQLQLYSLLIPMLYCDAITDAMTKGLGQQKICVRYNIITSTLDVVFLFFLLPRYGMMGYFFSFTLTHLLNFCLSLRRLLIITGEPLSSAMPFWTVVSFLAAVFGASLMAEPFLRLLSYFGILFSLWTIFGILSTQTLQWLRGLILGKPESA